MTTNNDVRLSPLEFLDEMENNNNMGFPLLDFLLKSCPKNFYEIKEARCKMVGQFNVDKTAAIAVEICICLKEAGEDAMKNFFQPQNGMVDMSISKIMEAAFRESDCKYAIRLLKEHKEIISEMPESIRRILRTMIMEKGVTHSCA